MKKKAIDIVMQQRNSIVEKIISNMEKGYFFSPERWNKNALRPQNPVSNVKYNGVNRFILGLTAIEKEYKDPRWITYNQAKENNLIIKKEELRNYTICEKWIWSKEIEEEKENGEKEKKLVKLDRPQVFYFRVYNGEQVENMPKLEIKNLKETEITKLADDFISSSECEIQELAQEKSFYSPDKDKIVLPLRNSFSSDQDFLATLWHEMAHSTGAENRFNREIKNLFGDEKYAREELTAELSAVFLEAEFGIEQNLKQEHTNYFISWINALKENPKELFKVANESSKICDYLINNYEKVIEKQKESLLTQEEILLKIEPKIRDKIKELNISQNNIIKYSDFLIKQHEINIECANRVLENINKIENLKSECKVIIVWSENSSFRSGEVLSLKDANEKFEREENICREEIGYDKTKFVLLIPEKEGIYKSIVDRLDIGDGYQKNLYDFVEKNYRIKIEDIENIKGLEKNLFNKTKELYKELLSEDDIKNPKNEKYIKCKKELEDIKINCNDKGINKDTQEEIINLAKKELKEELKEEIDDLKQEKTIEIQEEIFAEVE